MRDSRGRPSRITVVASAPRAGAFAPGPQAQPAPSRAPGDLRPEPSAAYPSLSGACNAVQRIMAERLAVGIKRADSVTYENEFVRARRTGCELTASGTTSPDTASRDAGGSLADGLTAAGWVDVPRYTADGPDGSIFGMRSRETLCIFRGSWDGGDDSDSTYVPSPDWQFVAHCAAQEPGDSL